MKWGEEEKMPVLSEHVSTCVCLWRCQHIGDTLDKILSNRSCSPRSGQTAVSKSYTHTHTLFLLLWPWQTPWKAQIKKPIMLPWAAHRETTKSSCQNNRERETKREKAKKCQWRRGRDSLFKCLSHCIFHIAQFLKVNDYPLFHGNKARQNWKWSERSHN